MHKVAVTEVSPVVDAFLPQRKVGHRFGTWLGFGTFTCVFFGCCFLARYPGLMIVGAKSLSNENQLWGR